MRKTAIAAFAFHRGLSPLIVLLNMAARNTRGDISPRIAPEQQLLRSGIPTVRHRGPKQPNITQLVPGQHRQSFGKHGQLVRADRLPRIETFCRSHRPGVDLVDVISAMSLRGRAEMAMVPIKECRMPTLYPGGLKQAHGRTPTSESSTATTLHGAIANSTLL